jgi:glycosyltransferase involved in cell wall biosynthesis
MSNASRDSIAPIPPAHQSAPSISIVVPVYNESESVSRLVEAIGQAMIDSGLTDFELIVTDDGSTDGTAKQLESLARKTPWLRGQYLIRNYGQSTALQAGFDAAQGDIIVTLDGDLQNEPRDIPRLITLLRSRPEIDAISGWRIDRQDSGLSRKLPSRLANALISWVTGVRLHDYGCALKVYRREIVEGLRLYGEQHRFIPALAAEAGARILEVPVAHHARQFGVSKYGIGRWIRVVVDLMWIKFLLRFLQRPMHAIGSGGVVLGLAGSLILGWMSILKIGYGESIGQRPLLLLGLLLVVVGAQTIAVGLLGELLIRIYHEPGGRAQYRLRATARAATGSRAPVVRDQ